MSDSNYDIDAQRIQNSAIGDNPTVNNYFGTLPPLDEKTRTRMLAAYREHLRRNHETLDVSGLALPQVDGRPVDPTLMHIPLDRVYIKLRALPGRHRTDEERTEAPEDLAHHISEQQRLQREEAARRAAQEAIAPEKAVREHPQLVILGPPGAGKSTFLRHLAWAKAQDDYLPLFIPLGRADVAITGRYRLLDAALDILTEHAADSETLKVVLKREIAARRVLWLWDALDEVRIHRQDVLSVLSKLVTDGHRMVITSRPWGYAPLPGLDTLYEVLPLQAEDTRTFVTRWFHALAEARGDIPPEAREPWAEERRVWMESQLQARPGLREVARNPLMLTFLAVLAGDDPRHDFPRYRKDLYARFIERLIVTWEAHKKGGENVPLLSGFADPAEAREVALFGFEQIAWHLHQAYTGQPTQATRKTTTKMLAAALQKELGTNRLKAKSQAKSILTFWQRAGLLDTYPLRGVDYLAFRHLTFQEYGAARALAEEYGTDTEKLWAVLESHLLEDDWAEVIPLTLAHLKDATQLVKRLLTVNAKDKAGQRPLFRAAAAIADGTAMTDEIKRQVIDGLAWLARTRALWKRRERASASAAFDALSRMENDTYAVGVLFALAQDTKVDALNRMQAAKTMGKLGRAEQTAALFLALVLDTKGEAIVRVVSAKALGKLGRADEETQAWVALMQDTSVDARYRVNAAEALDRLGHTEQAATILFALARDTKVWGKTRVGAAEALGRLSRAEPAAAILLALAQDTSMDAMHRAQAAWALEKLGRADSLLSLVQDTKVEARVRVAAAKALEKLGRADQVADILLALARDTSVDAWPRMDAAEALGRLGRADQAAAILLDMAQDTQVNAVHRVAAAEALGRLGHTKQASDILLALAQDTKMNVGKRMEAVDALSRLGRADLLLTLAQGTKVGAKIRMWAAETLGKLGRVEQATAILLAIAQDTGVDAWDRAWAAETLEKLGCTAQATEMLLALAKDTRVDADDRIRAAKALGKLGRADQAAAILLDLAQDTKRKDRVRVIAAKELGELGHADQAADLLLALTQDTRIEIEWRIWAVRALEELGHEAATPKVLAGLQALEADPKAPSMVREAAQKALEYLHLYV